MPYNLKPETRHEAFLDKAAGNTHNLNPVTREEMFLDNIANAGGGGGFTPTTEQLAAMNSGITAEDVTQIGVNKNNILLEQGKTTGMTEGGTNYITVNGIRVYVSSTAPTGARTGDLWIGG